MLIKEKDLSLALTDQTKNKNLITPIIQHYAVIHHRKYRTQPVGVEMGRITNDFKRVGHSDRHSMETLFRSFSSGQSVIPSNIEVEPDPTGNGLGNIRFVSSSIVTLDVDDDDCLTNPTQVLEQLKETCTGLFYTFSHGIKGNRYRLVFQLDRPITDELKYKMLVELLADDLHKQGIPVDRQAKNPTTPIRTGTKGYIINDLTLRLNVDTWMDRVNRENIKRIEKARTAFETEIKYKTTFEELQEMAKTIGYLSSGSGVGEMWKSIVVGIKHHANSGAITQEQGYELFDIISGGEQPLKTWDNLRASGQVTIGTLIHYAREKGYRRKAYRYALETTEIKHPTEHLKVNRHIPSELAKTWLERKQRLLVDAPTGSGKTTAVMNAFKELATPNKNHFYIFSAPTRALAEQVAMKHGVMVVKGNTEQLHKQIFAYMKSGNRIFVSTYDMAPALIDLLKSWNKPFAYSLVIDEIHKYVTDYNKNYRYDAITGLHKATFEAISFIGLSGTPEDILKSEFDSIIKIDNGKPSSPCDEFAVYTYEKQKDALPMLVQLVEAWTVKRKLLIYIQSKETLTKLYDLLRKRGIITRTVSATEKRNSTYKSLVEKENIPDEVQVVLATSVIADGININNSMEWECIAVCNNFSDLFNVAVIKQMSNRFRNEYRRFSIFMQQAKNQDDDLFKIDGAYRYIHTRANRYAKLINEQFKPKDHKLFLSSVIERNYGLYSNGEEVVLDTFHLRHIASKEQEQYYKGRRVAFVRAVERSLHKKNAGTLNINEAVRNKALDISLIENEISELDAAIELDTEAKKAGIGEAFTREVFLAFQEDNNEVLQDFKRLVLPIHYASIERLHKITNYEICRKIVLQIHRKADTHAFYNHLRALVDIWYFRAYDRLTATKKVFLSLGKLDGFIENSDFDKHILKIAKMCRVTTKDVKGVLNSMFSQQKKRNMHERSTKIEPLSTEFIANKYSLTVEEVKLTLGLYLKDQPTPVQIAAQKYL